MSVLLGWLGQAALAMIVSAITSAITILILYSKINHRIELAENATQSIQAVNEKLTAKVSKFDHDLEQHQRDDNERLKEIDDKLAEIDKKGTRIEEALLWMKATMLRHEKGHDGLTKQVNELSKQVAVQARKPIPRKRGG